MPQTAAFSKEAEKCVLLGDSQEYPNACQRLAALAGAQEADNRKS